MYLVIIYDIFQYKIRRSIHNPPFALKKKIFLTSSSLVPPSKKKLKSIEQMNMYGANSNTLLVVCMFFGSKQSGNGMGTFPKQTILFWTWPQPIIAPKKSIK